MRCNRCNVIHCETREILIKHINPKLEEIIERNCNDYEEEKDRKNKI